MLRSFAVTALLLASATVWPSAALADPKLLHNEPLVGIATARQVVRGVPGGGVPWVVAEGSRAKLDADGELRVKVKGLVFAPGTSNAGTRGTVDQVFASVVCADGRLVDTGSVPLSLAGDAKIEEDVTLPSGCADPIVLVRITGAGRWIAEAGL